MEKTYGGKSRAQVGAAGRVERVKRMLIGEEECGKEREWPMPSHIAARPRARLE